MLFPLANLPAMNPTLSTVSIINHHQPLRLPICNIPSSSIIHISLIPLLSSIFIINTKTTTTTTTMILNSIHLKTTLHHHTQPSRLRILFPTQACLLASKKEPILRLEKTRHRTASNGVNRRASPSISPPNPNPNPKWHRVGMRNG